MPQITASNSPNLTVGEYEVFTASISGGTPTYIYNFQVFNSVTNAVIANQLGSSSTFTWQVPAADLGNTISATVLVTDSASTAASMVSAPLSAINIPAPPSNSTTTTSSTTTTTTTSTVSTLPTSTTTSTTTTTTIPTTLPTTSSTTTSTTTSTTSTTTTSTTTATTTIPAPTNAILTISNTLIDQGQSILFTASFTAGTPPYTYNYQIVNSITGIKIANQIYTNVASTTNAFLWTPKPNLYTSNTFKANVIVTDASHATTNSIYRPIGYNSLLAIPTILVSNTIMDAGQYTFISAQETGGTAPYTYNFLIFNSVSNKIVANQLGSSNTFLVQSSSLWTTNAPIKSEVIVTDRATTPNSSNSAETALTVNSVLSFGIPQIIMPNSIIRGNTITITANIMGGSLPYKSYLWKLNGITLGQTTKAITFHANASDRGTDTITATATDNALIQSIGSGTITVK